MSHEAKEFNLSILKVEILNDRIHAEISDGRIVSIPIDWFPRLKNAERSGLNNFKISPSGYGVHWEDLDEDISIKAFIGELKKI